MGFRIAIVEDQITYTRLMKTAIADWAREHNVRVSIDEYDQGKPLLAIAAQYHIIFLDIQLGEQENGMELAKKLRAGQYEGDIIFTTNYKEYILEGYDVQAFQYLLKPIERKKLFHCLDVIYEKCAADYYTISYRGQAIKLKYGEIVYITSSNHNVDFHMKEPGRVYSPKLRFKNVVEEFPGNFRQCHRTILVNMNYVNYVSGTELCLSDGTRLPISATYLSAIQQTMIKALRE